MQKIILWLKVSRPQASFASICPVVIGLLTVDKITSPLVAAVTLICAMSLQFLSNFVNDYYDFKKGADKSGRLGFSRALAEGLVSVKAIKNACFIMLGISIVLGAFLILKGGFLIALIGILAIIFAWLYTATRFSLAYLGLADIVCLLFYGPLASLGTAYLQNTDISLTTILAGCVCGCLSDCVLFTNNIRDIDDDRAVGKRTLAVRMGKKASLVTVAMLLVAVVVFSYFAFGAFVAVGMLIVGTLVYVKMLRSAGREYNKCLLLFGLANVVYVVLAAVEMMI